MTPASAIASYRRAMAIAGTTVTIRRYFGSGSDRASFEVRVPARIRDYNPDELVGDIQQGDQEVIVLVEDLVARQMALPLERGDKAVIRGRECNIEAPDGNTRRIAGVLIAYELQVRG